MEAKFIMSIADLVVKYGITGAVEVIKNWNVEEPTLEDIEALPDLKPPSTYFTGRDD